MVGGCWSESMKDEPFDLYPFVDLAFGPGAIHRLGDYISAGGEVPEGHFSTFDRFAGHLPAKRERPAPGLASDLAGLQLALQLLHRAERARPRAEPLAGRSGGRGRRLAGDGVRELTLLGQNVNSWGRDLPPAERATFGDLLRRLDAVDGIARLRFTSPHPKDMRADVISAMAECDAVCEHLTCRCSRARPAC